MAEETTVLTTEDDWDDIDLSDVEVTVEQDVEATDQKPVEADQQKQTDGEAETEPVTPETKEVTDQFTLKHLDETRTVSRDEVVVLAQKGMDYDRIRQKHEELSAANAALAKDKAGLEERIGVLDELAKANGFKNADEMIDDIQAAALANNRGIDKSTALERIRLDRERRQLDAEKQKLTATAEKNGATEDAAKKAENKRNADFSEFASVYQGVKPESIPKEVWAAYNKGGSTLVQAYQAFENAKLRAENEALKKGAENKERSTGSRSTEGRVIPQDELDSLWNND